MAILPFSARDRAEMYAFKKSLKINAILGGGYDGFVMSTDAGTAIKALNNPRLYWNELAVYQHLKRLNVSSLSGFRIPKLIDFDDDWPNVKRLMFAFESRGIFLTDVHPRNVSCR